mmetsp:Transcript_29591/g.85829  ORF Transcript_29591/g.85829 Transcript_29591/m.85829 type:complete len:381 (+) Transcript_29591:103-1245(+)
MQSKMLRAGLLAALAVAAAPPPPDGAETCASGDEAGCPVASEGDDAGLFQLRRTVAESERQKAEGAAARAAVSEKTAAELLSKVGTDPPPVIGVGTYNWWNLPVQRSKEQLASCTAKLSNKFGIGGAQFGYIPGKDGPGLAYECTKVPGLTDKVPEELRGVFWMKGNIFSEELFSLQNSQWFPASRELVTPLSPFNWAWAGVDGTRPRNPPGTGFFYRWFWPLKNMMTLVGGQLGFSMKWSECPGAWKMPWPFGLPGHACAKGSGKRPELTFAVAEGHKWGNLNEKNNNGEYTMELYPRTGGNSWNRGIYTRVFGLTYDLTSYNLVRILDGDGRPVEPWHSKYMKYIGNANLALWYNYTNPAVEALLRQGKLQEAKRVMR